MARRTRFVRLGRNGLIVGVIVLGLGWFFFARNQDDSTTTTTAADPGVTTTTAPPTDAPAGYGDYRDQPTACGAEQPPPTGSETYSAPEDEGLSGTVTAVLVTSCGEITVALDLEGAPNTVNSFVFLARRGFYDGTVSHRIIGDFMVQLGDPTATGASGPGYRLDDELPPEDFVYERGVVAMANSGPNTSGSQFFIVIQDTPDLPPTFTVIGRVGDGFDALDRIAAIPVVASAARPEGPSTPIESLYIERVEIIEA